MNIQPEQKKNNGQKTDGLHVCLHRSEPLVIGSAIEFCHEIVMS